MNTSMNKHIALALVPFGLVAMMSLTGLSGCSAKNSPQAAQAVHFAKDPSRTTFKTPEEAVAAIAGIAGQGDAQKVEAIFGAGSADLIHSGDEVSDRERALEIKALIDERVAFENLDARTKVPVFGNDQWPFPIPLVKVSGGWQFDTEAGREEIANRRIGINEIRTLATLHAYVDAQREYFAGRQDGRTGVYAKRVISSKGKKDGLYWPTPEGSKPSPLGPLVADATAEGYSTENTEPTPLHGYFYRPLTAQGANAPGGAKNYVDSRSNMTKGFAMVAWPARHGNSGQMTFLVNDQGIVFQKDLGEQTAEIAAAIKAFDPDESWAPTGD
ncbi:MAG: DUF2950 domain-containing protein [Candidatus Binatia bacterium]